jgi:hypothetical protein
MKATDFLKGNFFKEQDFVLGSLTTTITDVAISEFAKDGGVPERKLQIKLANDKLLNLNSTNLKRLVKAFGDDTEGWIGRTIELYWDDEVQYQGRQTGGVRIRIPASGKKVA